MNLVVDTDTAGDDAISLLVALRTAWVDVHGITINVGNVKFGQQVENALKTVEVAERAEQVPVYPGASVPLLRKWVGAEYVHGADGMGEAYFPPVRQRPETTNSSWRLRVDGTGLWSLLPKPLL